MKDKLNPQYAFGLVATRITANTIQRRPVPRVACLYHFELLIPITNSSYRSRSAYLLGIF